MELIRCISISTASVYVSLQLNIILYLVLSMNLILSVNLTKH